MSGRKQVAAGSSRFGPHCAGAAPWHPVAAATVLAAIAWAGTCGAAGPVLTAAEAAGAAAPSPQIHDPATAPPNWQTTDRGVVLGAAHITPAQAHAFYRARGFEPDAAAHYAAACVFQIVLRNDAGGGTLTNRLADWHIGTGAAGQRFVPRESWEREWARRGVAEAARIAFHWAQFPAEQQFEPGDWIMGMAALAPRPMGSFDLNYEWSIDGVSHRGTLPGLRCADAD